MLFRKKTYTDEELVSGCAANDRKAQEALYRRFFSGDDADVQEICF